jgi:tyrosyl-tRNA synthetase
MVGNSTEARNALSSNGVKLDEVVVTDPKMMVTVDKKKKLIQVGKKKFGYIVEKNLKS